MMMRILDMGGIPALTDNLRTADLDNPNGYYEFEPVKKTKQDSSWLEQAGGKVVKMVARLLMDLPPDREYRVVFMLRKLEEVIRSQNVMLEHKGKVSNDLDNQQVISLFRQELQRVEDYLKDKPQFKVIYINYNEMLARPRPCVQALNDFFGGGLDTDKMLGVVDPSLYRQREL